MATEAIAIILLVGLSAIFSGMESAFFSLSEVNLRAREDTPEGLPKMLKRWLDEPNQVLATLLVGNNLANITASALATNLTMRLLEGSDVGGAAAISIAVGAMTLLILIGGEVVPKTIAKHHPQKVLVFLPAIEVAHFLFRIPSRVLVWITERVIRGLGADLNGEANAVTEEAIENMVRIAKQDGSLDPEDVRLLTGVLELDDKIARDVMVPRTDVVAIEITQTVPEVIEIISEAGCSRYPVYEGSLDTVIGLVYAKDILIAVARDGADNISLSDLLRPPMLRPANIGLQPLLFEMKRDRVHMAMLISEFGGIDGLVTLEDIVEEVFGPIYDEHDGAAAISTLDDGRWSLSGVCTLSELEMELGVKLPEDDDFSTVAGLLMKSAGAVPEPGFTHEQDGWRFEVVAADETSVDEIILERLPEEGVEASGSVEMPSGAADQRSDSKEKAHA